MGLYVDVDFSFFTLLPFLLSLAALIVGVLGHFFKGFEWDNPYENVWITLWETYRCSDSNLNCNFNTDISNAFTNIAHTSLPSLPSDCSTLQAQYIATLVFAILACVASAFTVLMSMAVIVLQQTHRGVILVGMVVNAIGAVFHVITFILYASQKSYDCVGHQASNILWAPAPFMYLLGFFASLFVIALYAVHK